MFFLQNMDCSDSMNTLSQNTTIKKQKKYRTQPVISRKVVSFNELLNLERKKSAREAADLLEVPNSTMQAWVKQKASNNPCSELSEFLSTPSGKEFLQKNTMAVMKLMKCGPGGIRGMQEYLCNSGLNDFVAASEGALQDFWVRCEDHIIDFAQNEEKRLAVGMRHRKITAGLDEMFRGKRPCLVAIEVVSNYIVLEKFTDDRTADTWKKELEPRLNELNIEIGQVVSDLCGAIRAFTKNLGAEHISEIFHAQYEISKGCSRSLAAQENSAKKALNDAEEDVKKNQEKTERFGKKDSKLQQQRKIEEATKVRDAQKIEFEKKENCRRKVREAIKELGKIHNPIDLNTGTLQTPIEIENQFNEQFKIVHECAKEAKLQESSISHIEKAQRAFDAIISYIKYFYIFYAAFIKNMQLELEQEKFFNEVIFPLSYLKMIWRRLPKKSKEEHKKLLEHLEIRIRDGPWSEELKLEWMKKGRELAEMYQRSSSCVEGRNGVLSLNYHRFNRLNVKTLKVLTIMHNFDVRRSDGTTAAERFFEAKHQNLFDSLVENVRIPGRPQKQYHETEKRLLGWEKRRAA